MRVKGAGFRVQGLLRDRSLFSIFFHFYEKLKAFNWFFIFLKNWNFYSSKFRNVEKRGLYRCPGPEFVFNLLAENWKIEKLKTFNFSFENWKIEKSKTFNFLSKNLKNWKTNQKQLRKIEKNNVFFNFSCIFINFTL